MSRFDYNPGSASVDSGRDRPRPCSLQPAGPVRPVELREQLTRLLLRWRISSEAQLRARVGISYGYTIQSVSTLTSAATPAITYLNFLNMQRADQLQADIQSSTIAPSFTYVHGEPPCHANCGQGLVGIYTIFRQHSGRQRKPNWSRIICPKLLLKGLSPKHVVGVHFSGKFLTGYGGKTAAPFNRFFMGGENDIRGFDIWSITPIAFIPIEGTVNLLNADGSPRMQRGVAVTKSVPSYQLVTPGGDLRLWAETSEYRIPIFGPVTLAAFFDAELEPPRE